MNKIQKQGFSLIELMIVIAVVGILAAIAIPSYTAHVLKSQRTVCMTSLLKAQTAFETYYGQNGKYPTGAAATALLPAATNYYSFGNSTSTSTTYTLIATALGGQVNDTASDGTACGTQPNSLSIDQTSNQLPLSCWTQ